jgi:predicted anti-sigma-YlaC factor YlaD
MQCEEVRAALSAAEGGAIAPEGEEHLRGCAACRSWAIALDRLESRLAGPAPALSAHFELRVLARLRRPTPRWVLVAAELLIFALGALAGYGATRMTRETPVAAAPDPTVPAGALDLTEVVLRD